MTEVDAVLAGLVEQGPYVVKLPVSRASGNPATRTCSVARWICRRGRRAAPAGNPCVTGGRQTGGARREVEHPKGSCRDRKPVWPGWKAEPTTCFKGAAAPFFDRALLRPVARWQGRGPVSPVARVPIKGASFFALFRA